MTTISKLIEERGKELDDMKCTGYTCNHETSETHYLINKPFHDTSMSLAYSLGKKEGVEEAIKALGKFECQTRDCQDGHMPLGVNEDDSVEWGGCPNCTEGSQRLEPYRTITEIKSALLSLLKESDSSNKN